LGRRDSKKESYKALSNVHIRDSKGKTQFSRDRVKRGGVFLPRRISTYCGRRKGQRDDEKKSYWVRAKLIIGRERRRKRELKTNKMRVGNSSWVRESCSD